MLKVQELQVEESTTASRLEEENTRKTFIWEGSSSPLRLKFRPPSKGQMVKIFCLSTLLAEKPPKRMALQLTEVKASQCPMWHCRNRTRT